MAVEAMMFENMFNYSNNKDLHYLLGFNWSCEEEQEEEEKSVSLNFLENQTENFHIGDWNSPGGGSTLDQWGSSSSSLEPEIMGNTIVIEEFPSWDNNSTDTSATPKRRRSRRKKNIEEIENQRMTHINVERNRRKQMNDYLSHLRSLMPDSYVQKGDQASIIGGAINYVKELEQQLHFLNGHKNMNNQMNYTNTSGSSSSPSPFAEFFKFPQYSTSSTQLVYKSTETDSTAMGDIEVSLAESHATLKISTKRQPKLLVKMVSGLTSLRLTVLHLNVTTVDQLVLYSLTVKVEDECMLSSVDEIATAVNQILARIQA
ncbi:hypothetical protein LguiA_018883 [Lonicera macranthoides]